MARRAHVRVDATVGAVRATPHVRGAVHLRVELSKPPRPHAPPSVISYLDVVDDEVVSVEALVLGIRLGVLEEVEQKLCRLLWPATLRGAVHLGLSEEANVYQRSGR